jgi:putative transposase
MGNAVEMASTVGIVALCGALGLSRATFYRQRAAAAAVVAQAPSIVMASSSLDEKSEEGGRSSGAVFGPGTEGATASPAALGLAAEVDATRSHAEMQPPVEVAALNVEEGGIVEPSEVVSSAAVIASAPANTTRKAQHRRIPDEKRAVVLATLNEDRFCNLAPAEVWATLLDEGTHICSERTMYRILDENRQVRERRNQLRHPAYVAPELMATGPNQLWSWDITKLKSFVKSQYFHLYVILDVFSRFVVGWMVAEREAGELAKALIAETCERQAITPGDLTFHADNGSAMVSQPVAFLLASLGVIKSHSRPHVSDDNPFSEAQFKTLKYRPNFPERFASLEHARSFLRHFFAWYNTQHHHDGLALMTPHDVHHGLVAERLAHRASVLDAAYAAHPERFVNGPPRPKAPPQTVWINPPKPPVASKETQV